MKWRPERLDRMERNSYKVIGKISDGGFGEIFKVKSLKSNELLALKHIKYRGSFSDQNYIKNEISSLSSLNHENIISFCDVIVKSREVNIIMEYADGGNLEEYVCRLKKLQTSVISDIFIQILQWHFQQCVRYNVEHGDQFYWCLTTLSTMLVIV